MDNKKKFFVTKSAIKKILEITKPDQIFNIVVQPGGCNGFEYKFSVLKNEQKNNQDLEVKKNLLQKDKNLSKSEEILTGSKISDKESEDSELKEEESGKFYKILLQNRPILNIDLVSLDLIKGSTLDYTIELIGEKFQIKNPNSKSSCSCGSSFGL